MDFFCRRNGWKETFRDIRLSYQIVYAARMAKIKITKNDITRKEFETNISRDRGKHGKDLKLQCNKPGSH